MTTEKFIIIYDTYCGWCYGAAPIFDALVASGAEVEVLHRNLFREPHAPRLSEGKGALIMEADANIATLTGQTFSQAYINNVVLSEGEILNSSYTAQAAALVHKQGAAKEFAVRKLLESKRYKHGISAQDRDSVIDTLISEGIPENDANRIGTESLAAVSDKIADRATQLIKKAGAVGVPTILKISGEAMEVIDHGAYYGSPEGVKNLANTKNTAAG